MNVPSTLLGPGPTVARRLRAAIRKVGQKGPEGFDAGPMTSVAEHPDALILLDRTDRNKSGDDFHCYALAHAVFDHIRDPGTVNRWFDWWLEQAWSTVGLLGSAGAFFFTQASFLSDGSRDHCGAQFLLAAGMHLDEWVEAGSRFKLLATAGDIGALNVGLHNELLKDEGFPVQAPGVEGLRAALREFAAAKRGD